MVLEEMAVRCHGEAVKITDRHMLSLPLSRV